MRAERVQSAVEEAMAQLRANRHVGFGPGFPGGGRSEVEEYAVSVARRVCHETYTDLDPEEETAVVDEVVRRVLEWLR